MLLFSDDQNQQLANENEIAKVVVLSDARRREIAERLRQKYAEKKAKSQYAQTYKCSTCHSAFLVESEESALAIKCRCVDVAEQSGEECEEPGKPNFAFYFFILFLMVLTITLVFNHLALPPIPKY